MKKLFVIISALFLSLSAVSFSQVAFTNAFPNISFSGPVFLTHAYDGTNRIFVVQQGGLIRVFPNDSTTSNVVTFLNLTNKVLSGGERGLLGLAFHPNYETNRYFYVNYTRQTDGATIVSRFTTQAGNPNKADSLSELILLTISQPFSNHNGGMVMFGLDNFLYIGMGDGGSGGDPGNRAQNPNELLGKILRINVDTATGGNNYGIPPTNPFAGGGGRPEIFAMGMRNPWRFSQDPVTGTIYCGDVGQDAWEEVDTIAVGKNYGWRCYEGNHPFNTSGCQPQNTYTFPITEFRNMTGLPECSVTGGYVYRGSRVPWLVGRYVFADYCSRKTWKLLLSGGVVSDSAMIGTAPSNVYSFGVDQNNELYTLCSNNIIYKYIDAVIGINGNGNSLPEGYSLEQNYPNPFNPSTSIRFTLPANDFVNITIFDVTGKEISVLVNENRSAGSYSVDWDALNYPSGVYFYRMTTSQGSAEKKMVLVK
jgi:hypothetical protein